MPTVKPGKFLWQLHVVFLWYTILIKIIILFQTPYEFNSGSILSGIPKGCQQMSERLLFPSLQRKVTWPQLMQKNSWSSLRLCIGFRVKHGPDQVWKSGMKNENWYLFEPGALIVVMNSQVLLLPGGKYCTRYNESYCLLSAVTIHCFSADSTCPWDTSSAIHNVMLLAAWWISNDSIKYLKIIMATWQYCFYYVRNKAERVKYIICQTKIIVE